MSPKVKDPRLIVSLVVPVDMLSWYGSAVFVTVWAVATSSRGGGGRND